MSVFGASRKYIRVPKQHNINTPSASTNQVKMKHSKRNKNKKANAAVAALEGGWTLVPGGAPQVQAREGVPNARAGHRMLPILSFFSKILTTAVKKALLLGESKENELGSE